MSSYVINHPIVKHYAGSLAYGTNLPTSDVDIRGIFCADEVNIRTPFYPVREITIPEDEDTKLYELSTFMKLYTDGNPNILESLWVDKSDIIEFNSAYMLLRSYREELLSSKVAFTFSGYAISQLKRIKGHNKWIMNPQPKERPLHKDYLKLVQNFLGKKIMPREFDLTVFATGYSLVHYGSDTYAVIAGNLGDSVLDKNGDFNISVKQHENRDVDHTVQPSIIFRYIADEYRLAKERHRNYWEWKKNRNEKRSALEEKYGYDCKHAMHLVRLLRMGSEILQGQGVIVKRPDAKELLHIRDGGWSYEELIKFAESKDKFIREFLYKNTALRKKPDIKLAAKVLMDVQDMCWSEFE